MRYARIVPLLLLAAFLALAGCDSAGKDIKKLDANCDTNQACQKAMASLLATPGSKAKIEKALLNTKKNNARTRKNLAYLLGQYAESRTDKSVFQTMKKSLDSDPDAGVRVEIIHSLPKIPGEDWVPALKQAAEDKDRKVAAAAGEELKTLAAALVKRADGYASRDDTIVSKADLYAQALDYTPCDGDLSQKTAALYNEYADILDGRATEEPAQSGALAKQAAALRDKATASETACGVPVRAMYVALPFTDKFKDNTVAVAKIDPADDEYSGIPQKYQDESVYWEVIPDELQDKVVIHMSRLLDEWGIDAPGEFSTYATFMASVKQARDVKFRIASDTHIALWVNGKEVFRTSGDRPRLSQDMTTNAPFKKGDNRVVIKLNGEANTSRFKIFLLGGDAKPIPDLAIEAR